MVASINMLKNIFNIYRLQIPVTNDRWVKHTLEFKVKILFLDKVIYMNMFRTNLNNLL